MEFKQEIYLAADTILIAEEEVLLIKRKNPPFQGMWAFPGGFVDEGEDLAEAASRELKEETCVELNPERLSQFMTYGKPCRDPRFHTVSVVYSAYVNRKPKTSATDDAAEVQWFSLVNLPKMAFDHKEILEEFLDSET